MQGAILYAGRSLFLPGILDKFVSAMEGAVPWQAAAIQATGYPTSQEFRRPYTVQDVTAEEGLPAANIAKIKRERKKAASGRRIGTFKPLQRPQIVKAPPIARTSLKPGEA